MLARLGCLFILVPLIELALLIRVGQWIGVWPTVLLVAVTGLGGALLARAQGLRALASVQLELARGRLPGRALMDGAAVLVAAAFLMTPGVLTDVAAFALLFPPTRRLAQGWILARLGRAIHKGTLKVTHMGIDRFGMGGPGGGPGGPETGGHERSREHPPSPGGSRGGQDPEEDRPPRPGEIIQE
jgi:UPF0716 protein FxsA